MTHKPKYCWKKAFALSINISKNPPKECKIRMLDLLTTGNLSPAVITVKRVKGLFVVLQTDYTLCHVETCHLHPNFQCLGSTIFFFCYHCHQECFLTHKRSWRKKIGSNICLMFHVVCSLQGWAGPSAGWEDGANEAGRSSAVAAHPVWKTLGEVRQLMKLIQ